MKINNTFAIGCLVQWYEIEMIGEYIESLKQSLNQIDNSKSTANSLFIQAFKHCSEGLEKIENAFILYFKKSSKI